MPKQYDEIRDRLMRSGLSEKEAQRRAAKIYNSRNPEKPVGPHKQRRPSGLADL